MTEATNEDGGRRRIPARLSLFGRPGRDAVLEVTPRAKRLRVLRAAMFAGGALLLAPVAAILPPHVPWALAVLGIGAWRARVEWKGEYVLHAFRGDCPACGAALALEERYIRLPATVPCFSCHAQPVLSLDGRAPDGQAASDLPSPSTIS